MNTQEDMRAELQRVLGSNYTISIAVSTDPDVWMFLVTTGKTRRYVGLKAEGSASDTEMKLWADQIAILLGEKINEL